MTDLDHVPLVESTADEGETQLYAEGSCHVFALALHRNLGWPMLVVTNPEEASWEDPADADNRIDNVLHVFAVNEGVAYDVFGARPSARATEWCLAKWPDVSVTDTDLCRSEAEIAMYVEGASGEYDEDIDPYRPLHSYTDADVEEVWEVAKRVLDLRAEHHAKI